jgi:hypothetical protein
VVLKCLFIVSGFRKVLRRAGGTSGARGRRREVRSQAAFFEVLSLQPSNDARAAARLNPCGSLIILGLSGQCPQGLRGASSRTPQTDALPHGRASASTLIRKPL